MRDDQSYRLTDDVLGEIQRLDPVEDAQKIVLLSASRHFPSDAKIALELALFHTYAVPSIGISLVSLSTHAVHVRDLVTIGPTCRTPLTISWYGEDAPNGVRRFVLQSYKGLITLVLVGLLTLQRVESLKVKVMTQNISAHHH